MLYSGHLSYKLASSSVGEILFHPNTHQCKSHDIKLYIPALVPESLPLIFFLNLNCQAVVSIFHLICFSLLLIDALAAHN